MFINRNNSIEISNSWKVLRKHLKHLMLRTTLTSMLEEGRKPLMGVTALSMTWQPILRGHLRWHCSVFHTFGICEQLVIVKCLGFCPSFNGKLIDNFLCENKKE